jgi:hypothetical protein
MGDSKVPPCTVEFQMSVALKTEVGASSDQSDPYTCSMGIDTPDKTLPHSAFTAYRMSPIDTRCLTLPELSVVAAKAAWTGRSTWIGTSMGGPKGQWSM